jgi:hypothetical protein
MNLVKSLVAMLLITLVIFELSSFAVTKMELFLFNETPSVYRFGSNTNYRDIGYGRTERDPWGAWHAPNGTYTHTMFCFNVEMTFNEVGARDSSFSDLSENSLFLLGDSFAEGFGVSYEDTSQYIIERELGVEIANFGVAGDFGPLQELLIYREFHYLQHNGLIIYVLPANDFTDNDANFWAGISRQRYRPYFGNDDGNPLVPYYFTEAKKRDNFLDPTGGVIKQFIKDYFWSANALRTALVMLRGNTRNASIDEDSIESFFYDANAQQQINLLLAYEEILDLAGERDVLFVIIPGIRDIRRRKAENLPDSYKQQTWYQGLQTFESRQQHKVSLLNLMDHVPVDTSGMFHVCDGHWSPRGNNWAATTIAEHIRRNNLFPTIVSQ